MVGITGVTPVRSAAEVASLIKRAGSKVAVMVSSPHNAVARVRHVFISRLHKNDRLGLSLIAEGGTCSVSSVDAGPAQVAGLR